MMIKKVFFIPILISIAISTNLLASASNRYNKKEVTDAYIQVVSSSEGIYAHDISSRDFKDMVRTFIENVKRGDSRNGKKGAELTFGLTGKNILLFWETLNEIASKRD